jgi:hypothetical protein
LHRMRGLSGHDGSERNIAQEVRIRTAVRLRLVRRLRLLAKNKRRVPQSAFPVWVALFVTVKEYGAYAMYAA